MNLSDKFCYRKIENKHLLVAVKKNSITNNVIEINSTTTDIILLAIDGMKKNEIIAYMMKKYDLNKEYFTIIEQAIDELISMGILENHEY